MDGSAASLATAAPARRGGGLKAFAKNFPHYALGVAQGAQKSPQNAKSLPPVRRVGLEDIGRLAALARLRYPGYSLQRAEEWARALLALPQAAAFVCGESVAFVCWQVEMWRPDEKVADLLPFYSQPSSDNPWGAIKVFKAALEWAREEGCYGIRFGSMRDIKYHNANEADVLARLAKRVGAQLLGVTYIKEF